MGSHQRSGRHQKNPQALGDTTMGGDSNGWESPDAIAIDQSGNVYSTGQTDGTLGGEPQGGGSADIFVAKFNSSGVSQWVTQLGDSTMGADADGLDGANGIALDSTGDIFVTGSTSGTLGGQTNGGSSDVIVSKIDSSGAHIWTTQLGDLTLGSDADGTDSAKGIVLDSSGNIYLTGDSTGTLSGEINAGSTDVFVIKLDSAGEL